jgi:predicted TIM-barrel fold metal-dependent hydrolase
VAPAEDAFGGFDIHLHLSRYWPDPPNTFYRRDLDFTVRGLLAELAAEGIDGGLILQEHLAPSVDATLTEGEARLRESGGRLRRTSTVDPTRGEEAVAHAVALWERVADLSAIKLYPGYRPFYPHDPRLAPVYEFCARRRLPILIHQGDTLDPMGLVRFARPIEVDEVAVRYRDLKIVLCHLGNPWVEETAELVYKNENVYTDTSGLLGPPRLPYFEAQFRRAVRRLENAIATIGHADRILYGSDWPLQSIRTSVGVIRALDLPEEAKTRIRGANARALLPPHETRGGLDSPPPAPGAADLQAAQRGSS